MSREVHSGARAVHAGRTAHGGRTIRTAATVTISGVTPVVGQTDISIAWTVSTGAQGWVEYGPSSGAPYTSGLYPSTTAHETNYLTAHQQTITGLTPDTDYTYLIHGVDSVGTAATSGPWTFHTQPVVPGPVSGAPVILNTPTMSNITAQSATSTVNVDQPCNAYIEYGVTNGSTYIYSTLADTSLTYSTHTQTPGASTSTLTPLASSTTYYGKWVLTNGAAQTTRGAQMTWTTLSSGVTPPVDPPPGGGTYPALSTLQTGTVPSGTQTLPAVGVLTADATTPGGTTHYVRISSGSRGGNFYPSSTPWNSDGTTFWDHYSGVLRNSTTWASLGAKSMPDDGPHWAWTNPNRMYGMRSHSAGVGNVHQFGYWNTSTNTWTTLLSFPTVYAEVWFAHNGDGRQDRGDLYFPFVCVGGSQSRILVYGRDPSTDVMTNVGSMNITRIPDDVQMAADGSVVVVNWDGSGGAGTGLEQGVRTYTRGMSGIRQLNQKGDHGSCGYDAQGKPIYVCTYGGYGVSTGQNIYSYRLDTGSSATSDVGRLLPPGSGYQFQQGHISMESRDLNGWAFLSSFSHSLTQPGRGQVIAVPTDGSAFALGAGIRVYGWHRSDSTDTSSQDAYDRSPMATPNADGTKVAIRSKWAMTDDVSGPFYGFVFSA